MKHSEPMWSVVCGTRRNGKQNPSVSMAFEYVVTHIADKTYKGVVLSTGQMVWGLSLYDGGSSPSDIPQVFTHNKYSFLNSQFVITALSVRIGRFKDISLNDIT